MTFAPSVWVMTTSKRAKLLRIRAADSGAVLLLTVEYDGDEDSMHEELCVYAARLSKIPAVGALSDGELELLLREDAMHRAMSVGLQQLASGELSRAELVYKLRRRGISREVAEEAARVLIEKEYLCEQRGAIRETERGLAKLWGDRRILAQLRAKGYGTEGIAAARERLAAEDGVARCRALLQKRRITCPDDPKEMSKLVAALMRYGYVASEIRAALQIELDDD